MLLWAAEYYRHPVGEVLAAALPTALREGAPLHETEIRWRLTARARETGARDLGARAARQKTIVEYLAARESASAGEIISACAASVEVLRRLEQRGLVERFEQRSAPAVAAGGMVPGGPSLNAEQRSAVETIVASLDRFATHLLYGVTGSGKTEVYLHAIAATLERGRQALVLVPEIALTPQLVARFAARFSVPLAVLHSALTDTERLSAWRDARAGIARIVIGTRSALFTPLPQPGLIVVDEEHDSSYKQQEGFRYSARDLAILRAQRLDIPIVLGSATPSLESLARSQRSGEAPLHLPQRAANAVKPRLALVDLRKHGQTQGIATPAVLSIERHLADRSQVLLFLNRRGYAPVLFCPSCGWSAHCTRCDAHLTLHGSSHSLLCHHCGAQERAPGACPNCGAPAKAVGQGTERIEEALRDLFPTATVARIDRDTMRRKGELAETLARVDRNEIDILVGTQMLTKGHDFPNVTLVIVLNADQGLFSTDFRAAERLAQTIVQVAGRAGRAEKPGEVLIQTEYPEHPLLAMLLEGGYEAFATGALAERERAHWPPYARIAMLRAEAANMNAPMRFLRQARSLAGDVGMTGVTLLGPAPAPMERRAGRYRAQLLLHADNHAPLQRLLSTWLPATEALPEAKRVRWSIDVDPVEMF
jgi:primosomal protein N' (replication factor Y)